MNEFNAFGRQLVQTIAENRMGMPAADFHDVDRLFLGRADLIDDRADALQQGLGSLGIAKFVCVFHASAPSFMAS